MDLHNDMGMLFGGLVGVLLVFTLLIFLVTAGIRITGNGIYTNTEINPVTGILLLTLFTFGIVYTARILRKY